VAKAKKKSLYSPHPGLKMEAAYAQNLLDRTGKTLDQWVEFVRDAGPDGEKERRDWLKTEHGLTTNYAWWIAERSVNKGWFDPSPEEMVDAMFAGSKAGLRPLYDELLKLGLSIGNDVKAVACKTIVPLYRNHVFAQLKPTTRTRLDFSLALKDTPAGGRLIDTGGLAKGDRLTHRFAITKAGDIDAEVEMWLRRAYEMDA
jgi:hypothetical protein